MDRRAVGEAARGAVEGLRLRSSPRNLPRRRSRNCLPKKAFPGYPSPRDRADVGPSSSHNNEGTRFGHVRATNSDSPGGECAACAGSRSPRRRRARHRRPRRARQAAAAKPASQARRRKAGSQARGGGRRRCGADADRPVRHLGRLYGDARTARRSASRWQNPQSSKTNPPNRPRDPAYAFVSTRPAEKVVNEVSVMIGYTLKPGSESTLEVGGAAYAMYTQGDGLWIKNAAEEERMVEAMRKAADVDGQGRLGQGHRDHRHLLAEGARPGARPAGAGLQALSAF